MYSRCNIDLESHKNADALSQCPCNRNSNSPLCKQCGPLLEPIDESEEENESKAGLGNELEIACVSESEISEENEDKGVRWEGRYDQKLLVQQLSVER